MIIMFYQEIMTSGFFVNPDNLKRVIPNSSMQIYLTVQVNRNKKKRGYNGHIVNMHDF